MEQNNDTSLYNAQLFKHASIHTFGKCFVPSHIMKQRQLNNGTPALFRQQVPLSTHLHSRTTHSSLYSGNPIHSHTPSSSIPPPSTTTLIPSLHNTSSLSPSPLSPIPQSHFDSLYKPLSTNTRLSSTDVSPSSSTDVLSSSTVHSSSPHTPTASSRLPRSLLSLTDPRPTRLSSCALSTPPFCYRRWRRATRRLAN